MYLIQKLKLQNVLVLAMAREAVKLVCFNFDPLLSFYKKNQITSLAKHKNIA